MNLAWVLRQMGRHRDAQAELDAGLAAVRAASPPGDLTYPRTLDRIAGFHRDEGDVDLARDCYRRLLAFTTETFGPTDLRTTAARAELAALAGTGPPRAPRLQ